ncbi:MAG: LPP20 family lipoprotein [Phycisphaerales bacterium]|nr:LPP20 family lipoprotein [Phycisphaerales bacterium]
MNRFTRPVSALLALLALAGASVVATGQETTPEQQKLMAKRAAEADAYRKLAEAVYGLQLNSRTYVKDFVTESDDIRGEVDTMIRGIRLGKPTYYEDGSCEVQAEVTVAKVVETLRSAHSRHYKGDSIKSEDFESITKRIEKNVIKAVGMGAPREDLPPELPMGVAEQLGPPPVKAAGERLPLPQIWRQVSPRARLMATEAARKDAQRKLAERIKGLRLTARTQVRDFVTESDVITAELSAHLVGTEEVGRPYYHHDELIVEVTMRVPTEQVIETIKKFHSAHYKGDDVKATDIESSVKSVIKKDFEATGMGTVAPADLRRYEERAQVELPDWVGGMIEAEGRGTDDQFETPQGRLKAARAAEMDARRKLAERIAGLQLKSETLVKDFVTEHDAIASQVDAVIVESEVVSTRFEDGTAVVVVRVPGMRVWATVNHAPRSGGIVEP